jgi:hypothetical protein
MEISACRDYREVPGESKLLSPFIVFVIQYEWRKHTCNDMHKITQECLLTFSGRDFRSTKPPSQVFVWFM